ncbi:MAG: PAS domain-containing protein [Chloroflexi bacterium]|nr:PAS domain-containing protein [Chloroflexota bacterium]
MKGTEPSAGWLLSVEAIRENKLPPDSADQEFSLPDDYADSPGAPLSSLPSEYLSKSSLLANAALPEDAYRLREAMNHVADGVCVIDRRSRVTFANKAQLAMLGMTAREAIGKPAIEVLSSLQCLDTLCSSTLAGQLKDLLLLGKRFEEEFTKLAPGLRTIRLACFPLYDNHNEIVGGAAVTRDITETRRLHRQLCQSDALFRASQALISALDTQDILRATLDAIASSSVTAAIALLDDDSTKLTVVDAQGVQAAGFVGRVLTVSQVCPDCRRAILEDKMPFCLARKSHADQLRFFDDITSSFYAVPLIVEDRVIGALTLSSVVPFDLCGDELQLLRSIANLAATAISKAQLYEQVRQTSAQLRQLLARTFRAQEEERKRIALDTHDGVLQLVIGSLYEVQALRDSISDTGLSSSRLRTVENLLNEAVTEMREVIGHLRPPLVDDGDLVEALRTYVSHYREVSGIPCTLESNGLSPVLDSSEELAVFRIVQEALQNVRKHADASLVKVTLEFSPSLVRVLVVDNGRSFEAGQVCQGLPGHLGLVAMRERAESIGAKLTIEATPGCGTTVMLEVLTPGGRNSNT